MWKKIGISATLLMLLIILLNWELVNYGLAQASGQLKIIRESRPIDEVFNDAAISDSVKQKIQLIQEVKEFAVSELGLKGTENYSSFYDQKGEVILWNLSACEPYEFQPKLWSFPFLGSFPYKGYFDIESAKEELSELRNQGYDARMRPVSGWSTLGWTKDPILSNMAERSTGSLAELIIHELTHTTLFVKDDIEFNENLATFIGEQGAVQFLTQKFGENSEVLFDYLFSEEDSRTFRNQMLLSTSYLDSLYGTFSEEISDSIKFEQKHLLMDKIISSLDTLHFHNQRYYNIFSKTRPNNAFFMSYLRYYSSEDSLSAILNNEYSGLLKKFVRGMKDFHSN